MHLHHLTALLAGLAMTASAIPVPDGSPMDTALEAREAEVYNQINPEDLDGWHNRRSIEDSDILVRREAEADEESHLAKRFFDNDLYDDDDWRFRQNNRVFWRNGRRVFVPNRGRNGPFYPTGRYGRRQRNWNFKYNYDYDWRVGNRAFW